MFCDIRLITMTTCRNMPMNNIWLLVAMNNKLTQLNKVTNVFTKNTIPTRGGSRK